VRSDELTLEQFTTAEQVGPELREALIECWIAVSNAGGAAGFPFPPVDADEVAPAADRLIDGLDHLWSRLVVAFVEGGVAGWVTLHRERHPLVSHWATVRHLQSHPRFQGRGIGTAIMRRLQEIARDELGLDQLHLAVRGGVGLEDFYRRLGWRVVGTWPNALRLTDNDLRDEILMVLDPV